MFFEELELPEAKYNLDVGSGTHTGTHAEQTGKIMIGVERVLMQEKPEVVLVEEIRTLSWQHLWQLLNSTSRLDMLKLA